MGCDSSGHDFAFWPDDSDTVVCGCGQQIALFDPDTGDLIAIRSAA